MYNYDDLKIGTTFVYEGEPYEVQEYAFLRMQQRKPVAQTKIKNLITGKILERNFHISEKFEEADIEKETISYLYNSRGEYWFCEKGKPANRFSLKAESLGTAAQFLKPNTDVVAVKWGEKIITIQVPVKMDLIVKETPPGERGNTAQGGTKIAEVESGAKIAVPLFINNGDIIRVNTGTGEYVERAEKAK